MAEKLLSDLKTGATIFADKAYDTDAIRNFAKQRKCWANIPKGQSKADIQFQSLRLPLAQSRRTVLQPHQADARLATRYDRRADNCLAALKLAATRIWIASANESASSDVLETSVYVCSGQTRPGIGSRIALAETYSAATSNKRSI